MKYLEPIIWLISWPIFIIVAFNLIKYLLKKVNYL